LAASDVLTGVNVVIGCHRSIIKKYATPRRISGTFQDTDLGNARKEEVVNEDFPLEAGKSVVDLFLRVVINSERDAPDSTLSRSRRSESLRP